MALTDKLTAIADAVRGKTGGTEPLTLDQMAVEIANISAGGGDIDALIDGSITEITSNVTNVHPHAFHGCNKLKTADFSLVETIGNNAFNSAMSLLAVILRKPDSVCVLSSYDAFSNTPIRFKSGGYVYVPMALIDSYKSATNWSEYASQFRALEDYTVDGTITGALDESKI